MFGVVVPMVAVIVMMALLVLPDEFLPVREQIAVVVVEVEEPASRERFVLVRRWCSRQGGVMFQRGGRNGFDAELSVQFQLWNHQLRRIDRPECQEGRLPAVGGHEITGLEILEPQRSPQIGR